MKKLRRQRQIALLGKATADIGNMLVHAENLVGHDDGRKRSLPSRLGHVNGNIAGVGGHFGPPRIEALGIGGDGLRLKRPRRCHRSSEACQR